MHIIFIKPFCLVKTSRRPTPITIEYGSLHFTITTTSISFALISRTKLCRRQYEEFDNALSATITLLFALQSTCFLHVCKHRQNICWLTVSERKKTVLKGAINSRLFILHDMKFNEIQCWNRKFAESNIFCYFSLPNAKYCSLIGLE